MALLVDFPSHRSCSRSPIQVTPMRNRSLLGALLALAAAVLAPAVASAEPPLADGALPPVLTRWDTQMPPVGYHREKRIRQGLVIGGSIAFGLTWIPTAGVSLASAATPGSGVVGLGALPVAGPLVLTYQLLKPSSTGDDNCACGMFAPFLIADALGQAAGVAMLVAGVMGRDVMVRSDSIALAPVPLTFGKNSAGLGLGGRF